MGTDECQQINIRQLAAQRETDQISANYYQSRSHYKSRQSNWYSVCLWVYHSKQ